MIYWGGEWRGERQDDSSWGLVQATQGMVVLSLRKEAEQMAERMQGRMAKQGLDLGRSQARPREAQERFPGTLTSRVQLQAEVPTRGGKSHGISSQGIKIREFLGT